MPVVKQLSESGVMVNAVGIGSADGAVIIDPETGTSKKDAQGNTVVTKLNETLLQQVAQTSNGLYIRLEDTDAAVKQIVDRLGTIEQKSLQDEAYIDYKSFFQWFVAAALLFLIVEIFIPERKKSIRLKHACIILSCGLMGMAAAANAQKADKYLYKGNELYKKQEFDKSLEQYKQALTADPKSPIANFNQGNAFFRQQKFDDATQSFNEVIENAPDNASKEQAYYNKGVASIKQNKLEESIDAWKNALKLNPNDQQARENLQKALRELKKKQQQQQQQKNNKNKDQQKQQQQQQSNSSLNSYQWNPHNPDNSNTNDLSSSNNHNNNKTHLLQCFRLIDILVRFPRTSPAFVGPLSH